MSFVLILFCFVELRTEQKTSQHAEQEGTLTPKLTQHRQSRGMKENNHAVAETLLQAFRKTFNFMGYPRLPEKWV